MGLVILDEQFIGQALLAVKAAKSEICLSSFKIELSDKPRGRHLAEFFSALEQKADEGVKVRILFNWRPNEKSVPKTNKSTALALKSHRIDLRYLNNDRCCHAKVLLVDRARAILGSHNLSVRSITSNFEISYLISNPECVAELQAIFEKTFNDARQI